MDIIIAGLGVSGSTIAYKLSEKGFRIKAFEPLKRYNKACGEQVTATDNTLQLIKKSESYVTRPKTFSILVDGILASYINLGGSSSWYIINKGKLVEYLRNVAKSNGITIKKEQWKGERATITIDARGPFSGTMKNKILVKRYIMRTEWDPEHVVLDLRPKQGGLYWIFPSDGDGRKVNVGGGFINIWDDKELSSLIVKYASKKLGSFEIIDARASPLDVFSNYKLYQSGVFYIGESAGLVLSISGEGNRPAIESAIFLAESILKYDINNIDEIGKEYLKLSKSIIDESSFSRKLFSFTYKYSKTIDMVKLMSNLPKWFWEKYILAKLKFGDIIKVVSNPYVIKELIKP